MKYFTFQELWNWDRKLSNKETRQEVVKEALERGYNFKQYTDSKGIDRWELLEGKAVCATGHFEK